MPPKHDESIEEDLTKTVTGFIKRHSVMTLIILGLFYNPIKDFITGQLPMRGSKETAIFRSGNVIDSANLIRSLENSRLENSNNIYLLNAWMYQHTRAQEAADLQVQNHFNTIEKTQDRMEQKLSDALKRLN
jgi:hypothetical protein